MTARILFVLAFALLFKASAEEPLPAEPPAKPAPEELNAYGGYLGEFDVEETEISEGKEVHKSYHTVGERILDGHCIQIKTLSKDGVDALQIGTFDEERREYKWWVFSRHSPTMEFTGKYSRFKKEFAWKGALADGVTMESVDKFPDANTFMYSIKLHAPTGEVYATMEGKAVRRKEGKTAPSTTK